MDNLLISATIEYVKEVFATDFSGHDFFHTMRVYQMATKIAMEEKADLQIVQLAALLHDVDDRKLSPETCENKDRAVAYMRSQGLPEGMIVRVKDIIGEVSFAGTDSVVPKTLEGKCVQDADRLDALGAMGIARAFAYGGNHNRVMYDPEIPPALNMGKEEYQNHVSTTVNHFYEKLFLLKDMMNTGCAKRIAGHREQYMKEYIDEFLAEWDGTR
ncbi:MAG: HD domain-containing protein [Lachnospiraceae bacterium]|nr:HD domain-containing protein [Lachnospiraceae bacterium]